VPRYADPNVWAGVPFHFWSAVFFVYGCMAGSFLNVCIHRMPRGESLVRPRSHCPQCGSLIPWYLNIPLVTWLWLRGRCASCRAPIPARYFVVELLTGIMFLSSWLAAHRVAEGGQIVALALVYCLVLAGFIVATFIDLEHFIIPDEITLGGVAAGFLCSFAVPRLHGETAAALALRDSFVGIVVGGGMVYLVLRIGKLIFGRQRLELPPDARVVFTETALVLPDREIPWEDVFYRKSDSLTLEARTVELVDRCYRHVRVRLMPEELRIGDEKFNPEEVPHMEVVADKMVLPREAMGLGDVKFMAAIGAFLGWQATVFALMASSVIGAVVGGIPLLLKRGEHSTRLPYGPYIALAAAIWMLGPLELRQWWGQNMEVMLFLLSGQWPGGNPTAR
jgi:leader peptidase (prepilin peptidase)/N-methyltransferase